MNVNMDAIISATSKRLDALKHPNKKEEFKKVLDNHEAGFTNSLKKNPSKKYNRNETLDKSKSQNFDKVNDKKSSDGIEKTTVESTATNDVDKLEDNDTVKAKIISFLERYSDDLKQNSEPSSEDKVNEELAQIQQLLQLISNMFQNTKDTSAIAEQNGTLNSINLEQLITDSNSMLKNKLSEIVALMEESKGSKSMTSQILGALQKLATESSQAKGELSSLKDSSFYAFGRNNQDNLMKDNTLEKAMEQSIKVASEISPKNQMQTSSDASKDSKFSGNSSFEEKFLNNLLSEDKDEMKISKAVNFMNQFDSVKALDTSKVQTPNLVIDKNNLALDVIKTVKFMELNNIKDLTVKMNPKELGEITIKLTIESGIMKANISAQNKDTYNLLNQNLQDISDKLKSMDIKIQSLDINIYEDSTFFSKDSNEKNNSGEQNHSRGSNVHLEEDEISISNNYALEENQVNKFV